MAKNVSIDTQATSSIVRQVIAIAAVVMGGLTASLSSLHLPPAVSTALVAFGGILLSVEHYVSDPSTGTPPAASPVPSGAPELPQATPPA